MLLDPTSSSIGSDPFATTTSSTSTSSALTAVTASAEDMLVIGSQPPSNTPRPSSDSQYELSPQQFVYVCLTCVFVTCLIIADVIGVKLFEIPLPFPIMGKYSLCNYAIYLLAYILLFEITLPFPIMGKY